MAGKGTATRRCGAKKVFVKSTKVTYKYATHVRPSRSGAAQPKTRSAIKRPVVARTQKKPTQGLSYHEVVKLIRDTILRMNSDPVFRRIILEFLAVQAANRSSWSHIHSEFRLNLETDAGILDYSVYLQDKFHSFNRH